MKWFRRLGVAIPSLVLLVSFSACDDGSGPSIVPTAVRFAEREVSLLEGDTIPLAATAIDASGAAIADASVAWSVADTSIAGIDSTGALIGRAPGETYAIAAVARRGGPALRDSVHVRVRAGAAIIQLYGAPSPAGVAAGRTAPDSIRFRVLDRSGTRVPGVRVTFVVGEGGGSVSPASALTDSLGFVATSFTLGPRPGYHYLTATARGAEPRFFGVAIMDLGSLTLTPDTLVIPSPSCGGGLGVSLINAAGTELLGHTVDFRLAGPSIVDLSYPSIPGTVRGLRQSVAGRAVGETRVVASYQGLEDTSVVRVLPERPAGIRISVTQNDTIHVVKGDSAGGYAAVFNGCSLTLRDEPITYRSLDPAVASIDSRGIVEGRADGHARIVASAGAFADTAIAWVRTFFLLPRDTTIRVGESVRYQVMTAGADGNLVPFSGAAYYSDLAPHPAGLPGSVTKNGQLFTAHAVGDGVVYAYTDPPISGWYVKGSKLHIVAAAP